MLLFVMPAQATTLGGETTGDASYIAGGGRWLEFDELGDFTGGWGEAQFNVDVSTQDAFRGGKRYPSNVSTPGGSLPENPRDRGSLLFGRYPRITLPIKVSGGGSYSEYGGTGTIQARYYWNPDDEMLSYGEIGGGAGAIQTQGLLGIQDLGRGQFDTDLEAFGVIRAGGGVIYKNGYDDVRLSIDAQWLIGHEARVTGEALYNAELYARFLVDGRFIGRDGPITENRYSIRPFVGLNFGRMLWDGDWVVAAEFEYAFAEEVDLDVSYEQLIPGVVTFLSLDGVSLGAGARWVDATLVNNSIEQGVTLDDANVEIWGSLVISFN